MNSLPQSLQRLTPTLRILVMAGAALLAALFLYTSLQRVFFPHEIKWMEGGVAEYILRLLEGDNLFREPTWEFATLLYMPVYYYFSAIVADLTGSAFLGMRLVSFLSALVAAWLLGVIVRRESGSGFAAIVAGLFYLGAWKASGFYLDAGRIDSLFLALFLAYVYFARYQLSIAGQVTAAVIATVCFFTKQTAAVACAPIAIYMFFAIPDARRFIVPVVGALLTLACMAVFSSMSGGWFEYFVLDLAREHRYQWPKLPALLVDELLLQYPFIIALTALTLWWGDDATRRRLLFSLLLAAALAVATFLPYMHTGSAANALMPMQLGAALLLGVSLATLLAQENRAALALLLALPQLAWMAYLPGDAMATEAQADRANAMVDCMKRLPQPVLNTRVGYVWRLAGTNQTAHETPLADVFRAGDSDIKTSLYAEFARRAEQQYYSVIFFGPQLSRELGGMLEGHYVDAGLNFSHQDAAGSYMLTKVFVARNFLADQTLLDKPFCEGDEFFANR